MNKTQSQITQKKKSERLFSIKWKLMGIFGFMFVFLMGALGIPLIKMAENAVMEKVEHNLKNKAMDTAKIIDRSIKGDFTHLETVTRMSMFKDMEISYLEKAKRLKKEADE